jgi:hypothetical protein
VGNPEKKRPLERPRHGLEYNIEKDLTEIGWGRMGWIHLVHDRDQWRALVSMVINLRVP